LWQTGNHDVRILAAMIARPEDIDEKTLDTWVKDLDNYVISDAFSKMTSQTTFTRKKMEKWIRSKDEWIGATGWNLLAYMAMKDGDLPDSYFSDFLDKIEADIHQAKNRTRHSMNNALIAIGIRNPALQKRATAAAKRIGKVEVDHGETGCKTPDAIAYIEKTVQRKKK
jgi:3-methyladenine DNA glycosylase AlkD